MFRLHRANLHYQVFWLGPNCNIVYTMFTVRRFGLVVESHFQGNDCYHYNSFKVHTSFYERQLLPKIVFVI